MGPVGRWLVFTGCFMAEALVEGSLPVSEGGQCTMEEGCWQGERRQQASLSGIRCQATEEGQYGCIQQERRDARDGDGRGRPPGPHSSEGTEWCTESRKPTCQAGSGSTTSGTAVAGLHAGLQSCLYPRTRPVPPCHGPLHEGDPGSERIPATGQGGPETCGSGGRGAQGHGDGGGYDRRRRMGPHGQRLGSGARIRGRRCLTSCSAGEGDPVYDARPTDEVCSKIAGGTQRCRGKAAGLVISPDVQRELSCPPGQIRPVLDDVTQNGGWKRRVAGTPGGAAAFEWDVAGTTGSPDRPGHCSGGYRNSNGSGGEVASQAERRLLLGMWRRSPRSTSRTTIQTWMDQALRNARRSDASRQ